MPLIQYISRIQFEFGAIALLPDELDRLKIARPMLITDPGIAAAGILGRVLAAMQPKKPALYEQTSENPNESNLLACLDLMEEHGCDGIIAVGGGSAIDLSKAVALISSHGGRLADYNVKTGGSDRIGKVTPQIAIPTAAGTGAEIGRACVMTLLDGTKSVAVNLNMVADTVICDPGLTFTLPPFLTAATGIDALSHGIEAYCSTMINPPAAAIALEAARRTAKWLPVAVNNGASREARSQMMMAALMGGMCLQKSLGSAHALANPLGELNLHHGTLIGVLLPYVVAFNADYAQSEFSDIKAAFAMHQSESLDRWMVRFTSDLGLPQKLSTMGVEQGGLEIIADKASTDHLSATNPRPAKRKDYLEILKAAY